MEANTGFEITGAVRFYFIWRLRASHIMWKVVVSDITVADGSVLRCKPVDLTDPAPFLNVINHDTGIAYG